MEGDNTYLWVLLGFLCLLNLVEILEGFFVLAGIVMLVALWAIILPLPIAIVAAIVTVFWWWFEDYSERNKKEWDYEKQEWIERKQDD